MIRRRMSPTLAQVAREMGMTPIGLLSTMIPTLDARIGAAPDPEQARRALIAHQERRRALEHRAELAEIEALKAERWRRGRPVTPAAPLTDLERVLRGR